MTFSPLTSIIIFNIRFSEMRSFDLAEIIIAIFFYGERPVSAAAAIFRGLLEADAIQSIDFVFLHKLNL
jgi:hypothetical protein